MRALSLRFLSSVAPALLLACLSWGYAQAQGEERAVDSILDEVGGVDTEAEGAAWRAAYDSLQQALVVGDIGAAQRLAASAHPDILDEMIRWSVDTAAQVKAPADPGAAVEVLLAAGAAPNAGLYAAAFSGLADPVRLMLEAGADPDGRDGHLPLQAALTHMEADADSEVLALLLDANADLTTQTGEGVTVLMLAAFAGHRALLDAALAAGAPINAAVQQGGGSGDRSVTTALDAARQGGHTDIEQRLLEAGAGEGGDVKALFDALDRPDPDAALALLRDGADATATLNGLSVLMVAAYHGHEAVVAYALEVGADVHARAGARYDHATALDLARQKGHVEVESLLIAAGAHDQK